MFKTIKIVAKHSVIYGAADLLGKAIGFIMIPLYTHYLTTSDYGTLEILDLTSYVISMFIGLGIGQAVFRFYYNYEDEEKSKQVISVAIITVWAASALILAVLFTFSKEISTLVMESADYYRLFNIMFLAIVIGLFNEIPMAWLRIEQKSTIYVIINLSKMILALILNIVFIVYYELGIMGILLSGLISAAMMATILLIYSLKRLKLSFSLEILKSMLKYSIPLMWSWLGMFVLHFGDRFILQRLTSLSEVGIYSLAYKFGFIPNLIVLIPFLQIWAPKRFELVKDPDAKELYSVIFTYFMLVLIYFSLGMAVMIQDVLTVVADVKFHESYKYVSLILVAYLIRGAFTYMDFGIHLKKKTKHLAYSTLIAAALNVAINFILIPLIGIWGAVFATVISFAFLLFYIYFVSQKLYHIQYEFVRIIKMGVAALVLYLLAVMINIPNTIASIAVKFLIAFSFPMILYFLKFYTPVEVSKMKELYGQFRKFVRTKRIGSDDK